MGRSAARSGTRCGSAIPHDILLGGIAPDPLKLEVKSAIEAAVPSLAVHITTPEEKYGGDSKRNVVNRLAAGGAAIQIEQKPNVRVDHGRAVAGAVRPAHDSPRRSAVPTALATSSTRPGF